MQLSGIYKSYGSTEILSNITMEIKDKDKIGIVGRNGSGKSTLLKIMAKEIDYDRGEIYQKKDLTIGYLAQTSLTDSTNTVWQEMMGVFQELFQLENEIRKMEQKLSQPSDMGEAAYDSLLRQYDRFIQTFEQKDGYAYESKIKTILTGLGFQKEYYDLKVSALSGGEKTRLALGKLLLRQPELLILDEPTNHLDLQTLFWLESYLYHYPNAVVIVSHDRYFLDQTTEITYEIANKRAKRYVGSYSTYLKEREKDYQKQRKQYEVQQAYIKRMEQFIERNIARASTTKRAQSRRKQLEKMEKIEKPVNNRKTAQFSFNVRKRSGNHVLTVEKLSFSFPNQKDYIFSNLDLHIGRTDRIALIGPNGIGKSTFLKILQGKLSPLSGKVIYGSNVEIGYYDQEQAHLTSTKTVLQELWDAYPHLDEGEVRSVLGRFLFSGDEVFHEVSTLSGGEKARLSLAKLMLSEANFLILDEPTNHLDIESKEVLEEALLDYPGTILFVSHDRYFINKIANQVVEMNPHQLNVYLGNYDYYVEKKQVEEEMEKLKDENQPTSPKQTKEKKEREEKERQRSLRKIKRKIEEIEGEIAFLEEEIISTEEEMTKPEVYEDIEKSRTLANHVETLKIQVEQLLTEWETLHEELLENSS